MIVGFHLFIWLASFAYGSASGYDNLMEGRSCSDHERGLLHWLTSRTNAYGMASQYCKGTDKLMVTFGWLSVKSTLIAETWHRSREFNIRWWSAGYGTSHMKLYYAYLH